MFRCKIELKPQSNSKLFSDKISPVLKAGGTDPDVQLPAMTGRPNKQAVGQKFHRNHKGEIALLLGALAIGGYFALKKPAVGPAMVAPQSVAQEPISTDSDPARAPLACDDVDLGSGFTVRQWKNENGAMVACVVMHGGLVLHKEKAADFESLALVPVDADSPVVAKDINGDGIPELVIQRHTGGAHCCNILSVYALTPKAVQCIYTHDFGSYSPTLREVQDLKL